MRYALGIEYDGSNFHGWQKQDGLRTVQAVVEEALSKVADEPISVICAGRTDAGVHAREQVIHFDTKAKRFDRAWIFGTNSNLPKDVAVNWAKSVDEEFHARFSAKSRYYQYVIANTLTHPAIMRQYMAWYPQKILDEKKMHQAAQFLIGEHDFSSFRSADCQSISPVREIFKIDVSRQEQQIIINITANAFLHHMVRNIAGLFMAIGSGRHPIERVREVLTACDRRVGEVTAPPQGLYLMKVNY